MSVSLLFLEWECLLGWSSVSNLNGWDSNFPCRGAAHPCNDVALTGQLTAWNQAAVTSGEHHDVLCCCAMSTFLQDPCPRYRPEYIYWSMLATWIFRPSDKKKIHCYTDQMIRLNVIKDVTMLFLVNTVGKCAQQAKRVPAQMYISMSNDRYM